MKMKGGGNEYTRARGSIGVRHVPLREKRRALIFKTGKRPLELNSGGNSQKKSRETIMVTPGS